MEIADLEDIKRFNWSLACFRASIGFSESNGLAHRRCAA
jgi:hypothetical protein